MFISDEDITKDIYKAWARLVSAYGYPVRELESFNMHGLECLKWLIEEEIKVRNKNV